MRVTTANDPEYETLNNRLLEYREYEDDGQSGWDELRQVRYVYYETGHVANITIKDVGDDFYYDLALYYTSDGKLWRVLWDKWKVSGESITNYDTIKAREYYYDGPRQRYLVREVDPDTWDPTATAQLWSDYNGVLPYGDFEVTFSQGDPVTDETMRYLAGSGVQAQQTLDGQDDPEAYLHGDLIGSTMLTTDEDGDVDQTLAYTAFGEAVGTVPSGFPRYQYAGGHGYESDLLTLDGASGTTPITLQHVGARWYQPDIGRFIQRDPIGIRGGINVYAYCLNDPLALVDPTGLHLAGGPGEPERDPYRIMDAVGATAGAGMGGVMAAGAVGGAMAGPAGVIGGAAGAAGWFVLRIICFDVADIAFTLGDEEEARRNLRRQREAHPDVFPPYKPPYIPDVDVPD